MRMRGRVVEDMDVRGIESFVPVRRLSMTFFYSIRQAKPFINFAYPAKTCGTNDAPHGWPDKQREKSAFSC